MKKRSSFGKRIMALVLSTGIIASSIPASEICAAETLPTVYAAAYQDSADLAGTTLPATVDVNGVSVDVAWSLKSSTFSIPYDTVEVTGKAGDATVKAQVEVIPKVENELVYFVDASRDAGKESKAFDSVKALSQTVKNAAADQVYNDTDKWGRTGDNFREKGTSNIDITKKMQSGWYSSSKTVPLIYKYFLEAGTYTLSAGFYEWWNGRSMKLALSGEGMTSVTSDAATVSGVGSSDVKFVDFTVNTPCVVTMEVQNATGGEAPVISWFAVAEGKVTVPEAPPQEVEVIVDGADVAAAAQNINGLTYKGYGLLSGNSTSNLLMDYKTESPEAYQEMLEVLFGGEHPLMTHVKMEMGNDGNNSTGADSCTMRFENEEADASRSPGFQLAADAKKINPDVKVSFLRWGMPAWVASAWSADRTGKGYEAMYKWYRETVFDAYEKYGYVVDYINPDTNETSNPDEAFIKWFKKKIVAEKDFPAYMNAAAQEAYHNIKIIASDENTSLNIVPSMRSDAELYNAVDAIGFHYRAGDAASTADYRKMADVDDKEVWYSEGCATFSYTEYQENKTAAYGGGTIGGYQSPLALADNFVKSFVYSRKTHYIFQPAVGSFYEGAQYDHKEIISAREPWAGYVHYDPMIYMLEHFSKFSVSGWENEDNTAGIWRVIPNASANNSTGSDHLKNESGNPSYMTLAAPDKTDFSMVMVNNSSKKLVYRVKTQDMEIAAGAPMEIWETKTDSYLQYKGEAAYEEGYYTATVEPYSMVTITSLDCDKNTEYTDSLPTEDEKTVLDTDASGKNQKINDNILYADDYEYDEYSGYSAYGADYLTSRGDEPRYTVDFSGAFVVEDGQLKQLLTQSVSQWNPNAPNCVVGDFRWMNYKASADVTVSEGYAGLNIRQQTGMGFEGSGYNLRITKDGAWTLKKRSTVVASGAADINEAGTYNLALEGKGAAITAWVDGKEVYSYADSNPEYFGRVRFGCDWKETSFDNLVVEKVAGYEPYATKLVDNASDEVSYAGTWNIIAGGGGSNNDWYRSTSTTTAAGATFQFDMTGAGFALIGENDGSAKLDIVVDGVQVATDAATQSSSKHGAAYLQYGLENASHSVMVTVKSGKLILDAICFIPSVRLSLDTSNLEDARKDAEAIDGSIYTAESYAKVTEALAVAKSVIESESSAQGDVDSAEGAIKTAVAGLKEKPEEKIYSIEDTSGISGLPAVKIGGTFAPNAQVVLEKIEEASEAYKAMAALVPADYEMAVAAEISVSGEAEGPFTVTIQVGSQHNGKKAVVLHRLADGTVEKFSCTVENGTVTAIVKSFSPFAAAVQKAASPVPDNSGTEDGKANANTANTTNTTNTANTINTASGSKTEAAAKSPATEDAAPAGAMMAFAAVSAGVIFALMPAIRRRKTAE